MIIDVSRSRLPGFRCYAGGALALVAVLTLSGCGGSSGGKGGEESGDTNTGVFLDSAIANIDFETGSESGTTNAGGEFEFQEGDTVTFSLGDIELPPVSAAEVVTPLDMNPDRTLNATVRNVLRLLQTIDDDGDPTNGIAISDATKAAAEGVSIDFEVGDADFENDANVTNFVANSGAAQTALKSAEDAEAHFRSTLASEGISSGDAEDLVGAHLVEDGSVPGGIQAAFLLTEQGGFYQSMYYDYGEPPASGTGYEVGTYSIVGADVSFNITVDKNGDAGVNANQDSEDGSEIGLEVQSNTNGELIVVTTNDVTPDTVTFATVVKDADGIAGTWRLTTPAGDDVVVAFDGTDTDGRYYFLQNTGDDADGVESGSYTISGSLAGDSATITAVADIDSNGDAGLADGQTENEYGIALDDDGTLVLSESGDVLAEFARAD